MRHSRGAPHAIEGTISRLAKRRTMLLHCKSLEPPMSQMGQSRPIRQARAESGLPSTTDLGETSWHVSFVPRADLPGPGEASSGLHAIKLGLLGQNAAETYRRVDHERPHCAKWKVGSWHETDVPTGIA